MHFIVEAGLELLTAPPAEAPSNPRVQACTTFLVGVSFVSMESAFLDTIILSI